MSTQTRFTKLGARWYCHLPERSEQWLCAAARLALAKLPLRFIGDASLAVFPIESAEQAKAVCRQAIDAAQSACTRAAQTN